MGNACFFLSDYILTHHGKRALAQQHPKRSLKYTYHQNAVFILECGTEGLLQYIGAQNLHKRQKHGAHLTSESP